MDIIEIAVFQDNIEILETLWCWGKQVPVNLKDDLLLAKGCDGETPLWYAAYWGKKVFETLCGWGRELQVNFEDEQLLPTYTNRMQLGAITQGTMYMRVCGTEVQVNLKNDLLLPKGNYTLTNCDLLNFILTQCCWIPRQLPLSH